MLNRYQRVVLEGLRGELIVHGSKRAGFEGRVISLEQILDYVQHCGLTRSGLAIENDELLDPLAVSDKYRADRPFELLALTLVVQSRHQLIVCIARSRLKRIRDSLAGI